MEICPDHHREENLSECLKCTDLHIAFKTPDSKVLKAVNGISFGLDDRSTLGIVGESGCGKSMTVLSIMRLLPAPYGFVERGEIIFNGTNLLTLPEKEMRAVRGGKISMIFQDPMTSLNPVFTCGMQIRESIEHHLHVSAAESLAMTTSILKEVGITEPQRVIDSYPHQLSGGMRQRVMIAMALVCSPKLLIADEPTTALDVTVQARILDLLHELQNSKNMSMILITHNLGIIGDIAHNVCVMYAGMIMEFAPVQALFDAPHHPYTVNLLDTIPGIDTKKQRLTVIPGEVPTLKSIPGGCPFHPRCSRKLPKCASEVPPAISCGKDHMVRCFLYE